MMTAERGEWCHTMVEESSNVCVLSDSIYCLCFYGGGVSGGSVGVGL
jgi:hypothetical protein